MIYISIIKGVLKMTRQKYIGEYLAKDGETTFRLFKHGSQLLANIELVTHHVFDCEPNFSDNENINDFIDYIEEKESQYI